MSKDTVEKRFPIEKCEIHVTPSLRSEATLWRVELKGRVIGSMNEDLTETWTESVPPAAIPKLRKDIRDAIRAYREGKGELQDGSAEAQGQPATEAL